MRKQGVKGRGRSVKGARGKARKPRLEQLSFEGMGLRGRRRGKKPGRKRSGTAGVPHQPREGIERLTPVLVTMKARTGRPSLRRPEEHAVVVGALRAGRARAGRLKDACFRIVHFTVLGDHVHLIVEADGCEPLSRGACGLAIRIAKGLNQLWTTSGTVWRDRFHAHVLRSPTETYHALRYLFHNARKHGFRVPAGAPDPCSSGRFFEGWQDWKADARAAIDPLVRPVVEAATWLLRVGWSKVGELRLRPPREPC